MTNGRLKSYFQPLYEIRGELTAACLALRFCRAYGIQGKDPMTAECYGLSDTAWVKRTLAFVIVS
jgi:hypothetical protein